MIRRFFKGNSNNNYKEELNKRLEGDDVSEDSSEEEINSATDMESIEPGANEYLRQFNQKKKNLLKQQVEAEKRRKKEELSRRIGSRSTSDEEKTSPPKSQPEDSESQSNQAPQKTAAPRSSSGLHAEGTLLNIEDLGIAIYKERIPQKGYDMVYILLPDKVTVQGIFLNMYRREIIGKIPSTIFKDIQKSHKWEPDQIKPYFSDKKLSYLLPCPTRDLQEIKHTEEKPPIPNNSLKSIPFGQKLIFKMGDKAWEAVYWTKDEIGYVVAHNTGGNWQLMHLDLKRFSKMNMLHFGEVLSEEELKKIHDYIKYHGS